MNEKLTALRALLVRTRASRKRSRRGMTLIEIMIVIAIILMLMGALTYGLASMFGEAQGDTASLMIARINDKVKIYQVKKKKLPDSLDEAFRGEPAPKDPWGNEFVYRKGGGKGGYDIISYGSDAKEGGTGSAADIKLSDMN